MGVGWAWPSLQVPPAPTGATSLFLQSLTVLGESHLLGNNPERMLFIKDPTRSNVRLGPLKCKQCTDWR